MKTLIASIVLFSSSAFACSPPLPAAAQMNSLTRILGSSAFKNELSAAQAKDYSVRIETLDAYASTVTLSNGCTIESSMIFKQPPMPGMCPQFDSVVSQTICK